MKALIAEKVSNRIRMTHEQLVPDQFVDREGYMDEYDYNRFKEELRTTLTTTAQRVREETEKAFER